jgi:membrane protease YdiL (CAAX protease family)
LSAFSGCLSYCWSWGGLSLAISQLAPWLRTVPENPLASLLRNPRDAAVFAVVVVVAGGVREEIQRAFILDRFERHLGGALVGLGVFSLVFGLGHALQGWDAVLLTATLGVIWGALYLARRSVVAPIVCHAAFNLAQVLYHTFHA